MTSILISFQFFLWLTPHKCSPLEFGDSPLKFGKPVSTRRIQQMCKQGEISNAIKDGRTWLIPDDITLKQLKPLPIGVSDFKSATTNYYYVDKTLAILAKW